MAINNISNSQPTVKGPVSSLDAARSDAQATAKVGNKALGRDDFMKLLIAQLKNQDPNQPLDTKELVTQLSQLTSVEQLVAIGDKLSGLEAATNGMAANQSSSLIGRKIEGPANYARLDSTGTAGTTVNLAQDADKVTVSVRNEAGRVVAKVDAGSLKQGARPITWDGYQDDKSRAPSGTYTFEIDARDKNNVPIEADMNVTGIVTAVSYENGYPELLLGTTRVRLSNVSSIGQ